MKKSEAASEATSGAKAEDVVSHAEEIKLLNEKVLRALAEAENTRRRSEREIVDARAYSITGFAREMLTVQDNLRRALSQLPEEMKKTSEYTGFVEGVEVTERELLNIFDRHGIKMISPKGEEYDHNRDSDPAIPRCHRCHRVGRHCRPRPRRSPRAGGTADNRPGRRSCRC